MSPTSGLSFGDLGALERLALGSSPRVDERGADGGVPRAELRGRFPRRLRRQRSNRGVLGRRRETRGPDAPSAGGGAVGTVAILIEGDGWDRGFNEDDPAPRTRDVEPDQPVPTREQKADAAKKAARTERVRLGKRAPSSAARFGHQQGRVRVGPEGAEAVSRAIDRAYRKLRYSAFAEMDPRGRDVCVDINVAEGTVAVLAQRSAGGTVEWEKDDTDAFLEAYGKRHMIRKIAHMYTEELNEQVSAVAADSYRAKRGEMVECTVVAEGAGASTSCGSTTGRWRACRRRNPSRVRSTRRANACARWCWMWRTGRGRRTEGRR